MHPSVRKRTHSVTDGFAFAHILGIIDGNPVGAAKDDFPLARIVQRNDRNVLFLDVLPDVALRPVGKREDAHRLAFVNLAVVKIPEFRALISRIPLSEGIAKRKHAFLGARSLLVAASAADGGIELILFQCLQQRSGLQRAAAARDAQFQRMSAVGNGFFVAMHDQPGADRLREFLTELQASPGNL